MDSKAKTWEYIVCKRVTHHGLDVVSSTALGAEKRAGDGYLPTHKLRDQG
jgi:hypothetical protein